MRLFKKNKKQKQNENESVQTYLKDVDLNECNVNIKCPHCGATANLKNTNPEDNPVFNCKACGENFIFIEAKKPESSWNQYQKLTMNNQVKTPADDLEAKIEENELEKLCKVIMSGEKLIFEERGSYFSDGFCDYVKEIISKEEGKRGNDDEGIIESTIEELLGAARYIGLIERYNKKEMIKSSKKLLLEQQLNNYLRSYGKLPDYLKNNMLSPEELREKFKVNEICPQLNRMFKEHFAKKKLEKPQVEYNESLKPVPKQAVPKPTKSTYNYEDMEKIINCFQNEAGRNLEQSLVQLMMKTRLEQGTIEEILGFLMKQEQVYKYRNNTGTHYGLRMNPKAYQK